MPRGSSKAREAEYEELVGEFREEDRYRGREEEVAARIVNKQRAQYGKTRDAKEKDRKGKSPDRGLPIEDYDRLTVDEVTAKLKGLSQSEVREVRSYEKSHKDRKTLLDELDQHLENAG